MALEVLKKFYTHATIRGSCVAIREVSPHESPKRTVTFAQLATAVRSFAETIEAAVEPGNVVMICLPNRIECTVAFLAALHARTIGFLTNPGMTDHELRRAASVANAKALVGTAEAPRALGDLNVNVLSVAMVHDSPRRHSHAAAPDDSAGAGLMLLSSGTTGNPKIVMRSGASLDAVARNVATATGLTHDDSILGMIPLCHSYGLEHGILAPTYAGAAVHLCNGFDTRVVLQQLRSGDITVLPGVPSIFELLAGWSDESPADTPTCPFPKLRCAFSAGSQLPMSVFEACRKNLHLRVGQLYGSSEVGSVTFNDPHAAGHDPMSVGRCMEGVAVRIVDPATRRVDEFLPLGVEGELAIHAPSMLDGYVDQSTSPLHNGFFLTGDLARIDVNGDLTITGRIKLLIDVGAMKVNPLEVENVLSQHDAVADCVVVAAPVTDTISRVRALVVPRDRDDPPTTESLRRLCRSHLSAYKVPRLFEIVSSLPKSPTGKILRRQIAS